MARAIRQFTDKDGPIFLSCGLCPLDHSIDHCAFTVQDGEKLR